MPDEMSAADFVAMQREKGGNKYSAESVTIDGIRFASRAEGRRYGELALMEQAGAIRELVLHPRYDLEINEIRIGRYTADFAYYDNATGERVVEDVKGGRSTRTEAYGLRKRMMRAIYGIDVREVEA